MAQVKYVISYHAPQCRGGNRICRHGSPLYEIKCIFSLNRWFAIAYLIVCFGIIPLLIFALSLAGWKIFLGIFVPILALILFIIIVNVLQRKKPGVLPNSLKSWKWLPLGLRSLQPYDKLFTLVCLTACKKTQAAINRQNAPA